MNTLPQLDKSPEWLEARMQGIGGSDAGKIMAGEWHQLWQEKTRRIDPPDLSDVLQVQIGTVTEPLNRYWFTLKTGISVTTDGCEGLAHPHESFMRANLDGLAANAIFEAKHVAAWAKDDEVIERYYAQLQHCMLVAQQHLAYLSVFYGNHKWDYFEVQADPEYQADLSDREREFWSYVESDIEPPDAPAVAANIALDDMRECDMTGSNEWASLAADWLANKDAAKAFKDSEKGLKTLVEADVKLAYGNGVQVKRAKNGALSIREHK